MNLSGCDVLVKGKQAVLLMIDLHQPNMQPIHDVERISYTVEVSRMSR